MDSANKTKFQKINDQHTMWFKDFQRKFHRKFKDLQREYAIKFEELQDDCRVEFKKLHSEYMRSREDTRDQELIIRSKTYPSSSNSSGNHKNQLLIESPLTSKTNVSNVYDISQYNSQEDMTGSNQLLIDSPLSLEPAQMSSSDINLVYSIPQHNSPSINSTS
ncbi:hypothetical protein C2G38_2036061 [Gigaspora rosea]|uniref:Uncharacterized protein n=1 Tax=Gigaspora rosea TaxID=44941 RepID=A0A397VBN7_9GLOM|nr:hypothetical protein C2G38_2036061 [Gigaspora rosea]